MKALIVDDSRAIRTVIRRTLAGLGYDVYEAGHGQEGLERLEEHPDIGLILVDWNMPVMDGLEFVRAIRKQPGTARLPLLMVTSETEMRQMVRALAAGANEYLMKPFDAAALEDKLQLLGVKAA
jgi:two-component system chemotaxis response regulator CheY